MLSENVVVTIVICYIITHTSNNLLDYKNYEPYRCEVMKDDYNDNILVNCHKAFIKKHINEKFNSPVQFLKDNVCVYEK